MICAAPWLIGFLGFQLYPIIRAIYLSFTESNLFNSPKWVGMSNYVEAISDKNIILALNNTMFMTVIGLPVTIIVALLLAMLLNTKIRGLAIFRTIYYLPSVVPIVAAAAVFVWVLNPEFGLLAKALLPLGIRVPDFINDPEYTKTGLIIMDSWRCGQTAIIFLAALQTVPQSQYEAAEIDGAGRIQRFFHVTVPGISPSILFAFVTGLIGSLQYFTQGFVFSSVTNSNPSIAGYGPAGSLLFYSTYLYNNAFKYLRFGYGSALAVMLLIIIVVVTLLIFKLSKRMVTYSME